MLEFIRKHAGSLVIKIFLGVLSVTFIFCFGMFDVINKIMGKDYAIKVGNYKISSVEYKMEKARKLGLLRERSVKFDEKEESVKVLHQIIWDTVVDLATKDFGFIVSDNTIKTYISNMGMFRDKENRFNAALLRQFLYKIHVPEEMFIEFSKKDIKNALIKAPMKFLATHNIRDVYVNATLETRQLNYIEFDVKAFDVSNATTKAELEEFYSSHQELFMVDEARSFKILTFNESDFEKNIKVTHEEICEAYESSSEKEDRTFDDMKAELLASIKQEKLQSEINNVTRNIEDALVGGEKLNSVVEKFKLNVIDVKDVNAQNKTNENKNVLFVPYKNDVVTVAFSTDEGADSSFSEAIGEKGEKLYWLVHVDNITAKHVEEFTRIAETKVKSELIKARKLDEARKFATNISEKLKNGAKISEFAKGRILHKVDSFDRNCEIKKIKGCKSFDDSDVENVFDMKLNDAFVKEIDGSINVFQVVNIDHPYPKDEQEPVKIYAQMVDNIANDLFQQAVSFLSNEYSVKINHEKLKEMQEPKVPEDAIF